MTVPSSSKPRFLALATCAPFLLWVPLIGAIQFELFSLPDPARGGWPASSWAVLFPLGFALIAGTAYLAGLFRVSRVMTACVLSVAVFVPVFFLAFGVVSLMVPVLAWLGGLPTLLILLLHYRGRCSPRP
jgi:hypothetical protein